MKNIDVQRLLNEHARYLAGESYPLSTESAWLKPAMRSHLYRYAMTKRIPATNAQLDAAINSVFAESKEV